MIILAANQPSLATRRSTPLDTTRLLLSSSKPLTNRRTLYRNARHHTPPATSSQPLLNNHFLIDLHRPLLNDAAAAPVSFLNATSTTATCNSASIVGSAHVTTFHPSTPTDSSTRATLHTSKSSLLISFFLPEASTSFFSLLQLLAWPMTRTLCTRVPSIYLAFGSASVSLASGPGLRQPSLWTRPPSAWPLVPNLRQPSLVPTSRRVFCRSCPCCRVAPPVCCLPSVASRQSSVVSAASDILFCDALVSASCQSSVSAVSRPLCPLLPFALVFLIGFLAMSGV
jgi:hypothetical protein